jgi:4-carboxymuconolactone decarboxylase
MAEEQRPVPWQRYGRLGQKRPRSAFFWEAVDPAWHELFQQYVSQGMYRRDVVDQKTRELCAVAALTVLNQQGALGRHLLSALDYGATQDEVIEVILQMSVYGGFPATQAALDTFRTALANVGEPATRTG